MPGGETHVSCSHVSCCCRPCRPRAPVHRPQAAPLHKRLAKHPVAPPVARGRRVVAQPHGRRLACGVAVGSGSGSSALPGAPHVDRDVAHLAAGCSGGHLAVGLGLHECCRQDRGVPPAPPLQSPLATQALPAAVATACRPAEQLDSTPTASRLPYKSLGTRSARVRRSHCTPSRPSVCGGDRGRAQQVGGSVVTAHRAHGSHCPAAAPLLPSSLLPPHHMSTPPSWLITHPPTRPPCARPRACTATR